MNLLYKGNYYRRFWQISNLILGESVLELCFGDTIIADYCKHNKIHWRGLDTNEYFVNNALKKGFNAKLNDINSIENFSKADTCIISGSLYHFNEDLENLFLKMLACAPIVVISEPIINLSNNKGIIGNLAKASASVKGKKYNFRFTKNSLIQILETFSKKLNFNYYVVEQFDKDLIIVIKK